MSLIHKKKIEDVAQYYSNCVQEHGATPKGVDWNGEEGQYSRFEQLCKIIDQDKSFSVCDVGCGYGALLTYLENHFNNFNYAGIDICKEMLNEAQNLYGSLPHAKFYDAPPEEVQYNYSIASGIFNVMLSHSKNEWYDYIVETLDTMNRISLQGFSFNCLTSYSDEDKKRSDLYYAKPEDIFSLCKKKYSKSVALLHDYGLYEFTILVRKNV